MFGTHREYANQIWEELQQVTEHEIYIARAKVYLFYIINLATAWSAAFHHFSNELTVT